MASCLLLGCSDGAGGDSPRQADTLADGQASTTDGLADEHPPRGGNHDDEPSRSVTTGSTPEPPATSDVRTLATRVVEHDDAALNGQITDRAEAAEHDPGPDGLPIEAPLRLDQDLRRLDDVMLDLRLCRHRRAGPGPA